MIRPTFPSAAFTQDTRCQCRTQEGLARTEPTPKTAPTKGRLRRQSRRPELTPARAAEQQSAEPRPPEAPTPTPGRRPDPQTKTAPPCWGVETVNKQPQRRRPTQSRQKTRGARARSGGRWCCRLFGLTHIEPNPYKLHPSAKEPRLWLPSFLHAARAPGSTGPKDSQILRTCAEKCNPAKHPRSPFPM